MNFSPELGWQFQSLIPKMKIKPESTQEMKVPKYLGYLGNEKLTPHTHTTTTTHQKTHTHDATTTPPRAKTHIHSNYNNNKKGIPKLRTIIGHSPHPPTCMWV